MGSDINKTGGADVESNEFAPVQIRKNRLLILNWDTDDSEIVSFFSNKLSQDRPRAFERALKIGVVASNVVSTAERIDYVQKEFNSLETKFNQKLDTTLDQLGDTFQDLFGDKGKFVQIIQDTFGDNGKVVKQIFDPNREGTPLYQLRIDLERQIRELRDMMARNAGAEEIVQKTTLHGFEFEDEVEQMLNKIAKQRKAGDVVQRTSNEYGKLTKSKDGDFVVRFAERTDAPVVIDTKDVKLTLPQIQRTLKDAMENRGANYGILVARKVEDLPGFVGWFNEYPDNQLVVALGGTDSDILREEILTIALAWARFKLLLETARSEPFNTSKIEDAVRKAETTITRFKLIMTECTNLENASQRIRGVCDEIKRDLHEELVAISTLMNPPKV